MEGNLKGIVSLVVYAILQRSGGLRRNPVFFKNKSRTIPYNQHPFLPAVAAGRSLTKEPPHPPQRDIFYVFTPTPSFGGNHTRSRQLALFVIHIIAATTSHFTVIARRYCPHTVAKHQI
jgi:hypothetical protein